MMLRRVTATIALVLLMGALAISAEATLLTIGQANYGGNSYNLIYDNDNVFGSIIWLDYSQNADTWQNQISWVNSINNPGTITYTLNHGYNVTWLGDWRLPNSMGGGTGSAGPIVSEMTHLYYSELGNLGVNNSDWYHENQWGFVNKGPFMNITNTANSLYWVYCPTGWSTTGGYDENYAWAFYNHYGYEDLNSMNAEFNALAVRSAEINEILPVPEPATIFLLGGGLIAAMRLRRRSY